MRLAVAQLNVVVGDLEGNRSRLLAAAERARAAGADLLVGAELALTGYPPRDLLDSNAFCRRAAAVLAELVAAAPLPMVIGAPVAAEGDPLVGAGPRANGAVAMANGAVLGVHRKNLLPCYDVFDEPRHFRAGQQSCVVEIAGARVGLSICEDIWNDAHYWPQRRYPHDPIEASVAAGAQLLVNLSASPFCRGGLAGRTAMLAASARRHGVAVVYVNQVGGNDGLVFDGCSQAIAPSGEASARAPAFAEAIEVWEWAPGRAAVGPIAPLAAGEDDDEAVAAALTLGLRDYFDKCGLGRAVIGLSGGIDSALVATLATAALGRGRVGCVAMPTVFSSPGSIVDAQALAGNLGVPCPVIPLQPVLQPLEAALAESFGGRPRDVTEENLQARLRGVVLMAQANKHGGIVLSTSNKSEAAVGYTTLYGDMCGGISPIGDLLKTEVYALARLLNARAGRDLIPAATLAKPPSAELRPNQRDDDSLPPYPQLDAILRLHLQEALQAEEIAARGHDLALARRVLGLVRTSEHKRRQAAPALRVSRRAFGEGRRLPVAGLVPS